MPEFLSLGTIDIWGYNYFVIVVGWGKELSWAL